MGAGGWVGMAPGSPEQTCYAWAVPSAGSLAGTWHPLLAGFRAPQPLGPSVPGTRPRRRKMLYDPLSLIRHLSLTARPLGMSLISSSLMEDEPEVQSGPPEAALLACGRAGAQGRPLCRLPASSQDSIDFTKPPSREPGPTLCRDTECGWFACHSPLSLQSGQPPQPPFRAASSASSQGSCSENVHSVTKRPAPASPV